MDDRPLSYWTTVARMGFENDLHRILEELDITRAELAERLGASPAYITKVLNGAAGNFQLSTMAKWARAIGAIVQVRLIKEGSEVVRVVNYEMAGALDNLNAPPESDKQEYLATVVDVNQWKNERSTARIGAVARTTTAELRSDHG